MRYFFLLTISAIVSTSIVHAQSNLLESVKKNPKEAKNFCQKFQKLNSKGISARSKESLEIIRQQKNISPIDAEILSMYIRGLYCSEVF